MAKQAVPVSIPAPTPARFELSATLLSTEERVWLQGLEASYLRALGPYARLSVVRGSKPPTERCWQFLLTLAEIETDAARFVDERDERPRFTLIGL